MKLVTCPHCGADRIGPVSDAAPRGRAVVMSRFNSGGAFPVILKCHRCTNAIKLDPVRFNGLPEMTDEQVSRLAPSLQPAVD
jgi:hypothetical protein